MPGPSWASADLLNWQGPTRGRWGNKETNLPLITNLLQRSKYRDYYLKQVRNSLSRFFNEDYFRAEMARIQLVIEDSALKEADGDQYPRLLAFDLFAYQMEFNLRYSTTAHR